ncbi:MAG TPA: SMP-30/gluconolactonase/LRE family protein [Hanamia sp.]|nr:SMP-30/gluconolactonase/LRE family protein [Hanamia sp.]
MIQQHKYQEGYKVEKIASLPFYTEGPATDIEGNIYCTTLSGGTILKIDSENNITEWAHSGCPNGQIILQGGDHLVCDVKLAAVTRFGNDGRFLKNEIQKYCSDKEFSCPNDLVTDNIGNLYFTDSVRRKGKICYVGIDGLQSILLEELDYPNGIILSHNQKILYVAESYQNRILKIELERPGKTSKVHVFAELPVHSSGKKENNLPDGLALDHNGNIWVAHYGMQSVHQLSQGGQLLVSIDVRMPLISNLCFVDHQTIVVTGGYGEPGPGGLFKIFLS